MAEGPFPDIGSFVAYLERCATSEDPLSFAIMDNRSGRPTGHASYMRITPEHRVIEVGNIFYSRDLQRSTGATEAMFLMAKHVFEDLGYRRYEWKCNALNEPSRQAALRLGFRFEGVFHHHMIQKTEAATRHGLRCSAVSGRRARRASSAGCDLTTSMKMAVSARVSPSESDPC